MWVGALGAHVLGHLPRVQRALSADLRDRGGGGRLRLLLVAGAIVVGAIAAVALLPKSAPWLHSF